MDTDIQSVFDILFIVGLFLAFAHGWQSGSTR